MEKISTDEAIDNAASYLIKKVEERHRTHTSCERCLKKMSEGDTMINHKDRIHKINHYERRSKTMTKARFLEIVLI